jgi:phosphoglycerate dehydrogenase-like enzyme
VPPTADRSRQDRRVAGPGRGRGRTRATPGGRARIRVHVDNCRRYDQVFWITPERYEAARRRHPALARRLDVSIGWDLEGFDDAMRTAEVFVGWEFSRADLARRAPRLRWIHLTGAGIEHLLPLGWVPPGVTLTNNSGVHAPKASEFAAAAILMLNNRIPFHVENQRHARWHQVFNAPVTGKTVVIVGVGAMGGAAARSLKQLRMRVLGVRRSARPHPSVDRMFGPEALDRILPEADFVLVTAPLTSETRGLLGRKRLDLLKPEAGLVNMGRAGVVDYDGLAEKLRRGELAGAILDVFDPEPLPSDSPLWRTPNLIMTPHVSSDAPNYADRTLDLFFRNVARHLAGRPLHNVVDPVREY